MDVWIHPERLETCGTTGPGIARENRDKIFTPFFTTRKNAGGTGLSFEITASLLKVYGASKRNPLFLFSLPVQG